MSSLTPLPEISQAIRLHRAQLGFLESEALYRGFVGGRGAGKTWVGARDLLTRCQEGRTYLVASPTAILLNDTTYPTFKEMAEDLGVWGSVKLTPYPTVTLHNGEKGCKVRFRTAEDPEKLRGPNLSGVWLDEASLMEHDAFKIAIASLRESGEQGWLTATFTPKGLTHWTYSVFGQASPNTAIFHATTDDNPFCPPDFAGTIRQQYSGLFAEQELGGRFVAIEGAEWPAEYFPDSMWFHDWPTAGIACKVMALDPSKGKQDRTGDYSAFVTMLVDAGLNLWVDADLDNARPVESPHDQPGLPSIVNDGIRLCQDFQPAGFLIETNGFQEMVALAFVRHARARQLHLPLYQVNNMTNKEARIRTLGTYFAQRRIRVRDTKGGRMLVQQARDFPEGEHDDGLDALKMAEQMADFLLRGRKSGSNVKVLRA